MNTCILFNKSLAPSPVAASKKGKKKEEISLETFDFELVI